MNMVQRNAVYLRMIINRLEAKRNSLLKEKVEAAAHTIHWIRLLPCPTDQIKELIDDLEALIKKYEKEDSPTSPCKEPEDIYNL